MCGLDDGRGRATPYHLLNSYACILLLRSHVLRRQHDTSYQVYDRMWQMDTHPHASGVHPNKMYHSCYVQQITQLADRFGVNTDNVTVNWISNMKRSMTQHWHAAWLTNMTATPTASWRQIYLNIKQTPTIEDHMKALTHPVADALHKLRGPHYPFQRHIANTTQAPATCILCDTETDEDTIHLLLQCPAYTHRKAIAKQLNSIIERYDKTIQQEVIRYYSNSESNLIQSARILSRTIPPTPNDLRSAPWKRLWQRIFEVLDDHIYIMISQRDKQLRKT